MFENEEEKKKREEEAKAIINSVNTSDFSKTLNSVNFANQNNMKINVENEEQQKLIDRINEGNSIINSINPRKEVKIAEPTEEELQKSRETTARLINLIDGNTAQNNQQQGNENVQQLNSNKNYRFRTNGSKTKEELDQQAKIASNQNVKLKGNEEVNNKTINKDTKIGLAGSEDVKNSTKISSDEIKAMGEANELNKKIEKGGLDKFEASVDIVLSNIWGGVKQTVGGLANLALTGLAFGVRGLSGASKIVGLEEAGNSLDNVYDWTIDKQQDISNTTNYESLVTSQIEDEGIKTAGNVTNVISNMGTSALIGGGIGVSGAVVQGVSVAGNSSQEVLKEDEDNIMQASLTGIAKGYVSYFTERMFDANILTKGMKKTSIQEGVNRLISDKISSEFGKEFANTSVNILGENIEELVEDNGGYLIDKMINGKDMPGFKEWWDNTSETAKTTTISTIILNMLGLGGSSFKEIEGDMEAQHWIGEAQKIIEKENLAIHFNTNETKNSENTDTFYITRFTQEGEIANIVPTKGKTIANPKPELDVAPVIVKDKDTNYYNVIDGNTGVVLDSSPYSTTMEAEGGFNEKANNLSDIQIKDINNKIGKANYSINNELLNMALQAKEELNQMKATDYNINKQNNTKSINTRLEDLNKATNQIQDNSFYNSKRADKIFNTISRDFDNVVYEQKDKNIKTLTVTDNQGNIKYSKDIKTNQPGYTGKTIKNILSNVYNNVMSENSNANVSQTSSEQNASTFYTNESNYAVQDIKKVTEPFDAQETYSKDEMADVWNNSISQNNYDAYYGKDGNIERYIAIEEEGDNLVVNQYDSNDNIVKSEVIPSENGRYSSKAIKDTIEKVSSLYDENRPITGQQDIEGNEVLSMKKKTNKSNKIMNNYDNKTASLIRKGKRDIIIENTSQLNALINEALDSQNNKALHLGKLNEDITNNIKKEIRNLPKNNVNFLKKNTYDLIINQSEIRHLTDNKNNLTRKDIKKFIKILPDLIINNDYVSYTKDTNGEGLRFKKLMPDGTYISFVIVSNKKGTMKVKTIHMEKGDYENKKRSISPPNDVNKTPDNTSKTSRAFASSINNSIPHNTKSVKNNTAINKQSMQNNKNNTQNNQNIKDNGVRAMKKSSSRNNTTQITTTVDNQGRTLSKQQQEYFKDSKVRDENGNLLVMYHGTEANVGLPDDYWFTIFDIDKAGSHGSMLGDGFYFTSDRSHAEQYAHTKGNIYETYLNIKNPLNLNNFSTGDLTYAIRYINPYIEADIYKRDGTIDGYKVRRYLLDNGYDGIHVGNTYVAFYSNQIKNVTNTNPTSNEDIRFAKKTAKPEGEVIDPGATNAQREGSYIEQEIRKIEQTGNWDNSIPVTKMTDIRKTIEDYLGLGVQKGHFREQAYGIYKGNRDVIRTKELKDIDTILHETGHALDIGKRINLNKESISNELLNAVNKYGGYEAETREVQLEEGFAEVIREYAIVPNQAKIDYPQTVSVIEGIMQENTDFNNFMKTVQQQTYNYIHQNPRNRILSNQSIGETTKRTPSNLKQEIMRNVYDKDWAVKSAVNEMQKLNGKTTQDLKASENAYYLTRLASGIGDKVTSMLSKGYIDENGNKLMPGLDSIGELLNNNPDRFNDLRTLLAANRDLDYKAKTLKTGMRTSDAMTVREQFKNDIPLKESAKLFYDTLDGVLQYTVNNGLITQENADMIRKSNAFYAPMQRVLEGNRNNVGRKGAVADIIKTRTGSELDIKDVLENAISNSVNMIQQVENNNILKAFYKQGEQAGMTGKIYDIIPPPMKKIGTAQLATWETELRKQGVDTSKIDLEKTIDLFAPNNKVDSNNLITSFINDDGKRVYLQFHDEILFNSLMNMDKTFMSAVLNINRKLNMPLRYGATMANLGFAIPNVISDTAQAAIFSEAGFIPVLDNVIGVMDIVSAQNKGAREFFNKIMPGYADRINTLYAIYKQTGATNSTRMSQYRESTQIAMKDVYGTKNSEVLGIKEKYKPLKRLLDILTYIPEVSEQSTRFRVFEKNLEYYRRNGMSETDARIQAALQSRDATQDFSRTGNITREINQLIPFSAARVGSAYTFAEKVKANPKRVASRMAVLMAISMAIKAIGYDDKEIEELNQRKKDDNFVFKIGDQIITIKKPQGILRSIINLGEYVQDLFTGHIEEGKEGERLVEWVTNSIMDNMPADSVTGLVPNMIAPVVENAINKDLYYNSDIVKSYDLELPDSEQYYDYNSQLAIWLGKIFNYSPAKIDNLISGYFAGLGTSVTNVIDWISGKTGISPEEPDNGLEDNAVGKRFFVNVNTNSQSVDEIYSLKTDLTKKANGGTITAEEKKQLEAVTEAISNISKLNKQVKEIKADLSMSGKEKAEQIEILQQQKVDTARQALGKELLYSENQERIEDTKFYPTRDSLSQNKRTLTLTPEMKKEYEELASEYYKKYEQQGLYSEEKLEQLKSKAKEYAKKSLMKKYRNELVKDE